MPFVVLPSISQAPSPQANFPLQAVATVAQLLLLSSDVHRHESPPFTFELAHPLCRRAHACLGNFNSRDLHACCRSVTAGFRDVAPAAECDDVASLSLVEDWHRLAPRIPVHVTNLHLVGDLGRLKPQELVTGVIH